MSFYSLSSYSQLRVNQSALDGGGTPPFRNLHSFSFDGIDDYFLGTSTYSEIDGLGNFAFSFWIKPNTLSGYRQILTIGTNSADYRNQQIQIASSRVSLSRIINLPKGS